MKKYLTDKEWVELIRIFCNMIHRHKDLRVGQTYMNALYLVNKAAYRAITQTSADPFYVDKNLPKFFSFLNGDAYIYKL